MIVVPPGECNETLTVSCITSFENYVLISTSKWIYIFNGLSYKALSFWKAHDERVEGLSTMSNRIWSFDKSCNLLKLWEISLKNDALLTLIRHPCKNAYEGVSNLLKLVRSGNETVYLYEDGTVIIYSDPSTITDIWQFKFESSIDFAQIMNPFIIFFANNTLTLMNKNL